ncbi:MAG: hypothetical protein MUF34_24920 [Polyangiaceae bacterium]|jgi:hypothetical protein|nr:hypothetical protein [Polyangiaceae bacterium]
MDLFDALRNRLVAQAELFAALSSHTTITGAGRERALADLLREVLPRRVEILSGVVARVDESGVPAKSARQVDLLIADTHDFPVLARSGELAVVLPDSVRAMIEVKTRVSGDEELADAIKQLAESRSECTTGHTWYSALFSYTYPENPTKLRAGLKRLIDGRNQGIVELEKPNLAQVDRDKLKGQVSLLVRSFLPELIVSEKGAIAVKAQSENRPVYKFYNCAENGAAVLLVSELLNAVTTETNRLNSLNNQSTALGDSLSKAVDLHSKFLQAKKQPAELDDLPI